MDTPSPPRTDPLKTLLASGKGTIHLAGICGVGMAGLALLLKARGFRVTGCDLMLTRLAGWLKGHGIELCEGHSPTHIAPDITCVVRSAAVPSSSNEIQAARQHNIPVFKRGEILPALLDTSGTSIAIAGTHGKTTTATFTALILNSAGLQPAFCIGGEVEPLGGVAGAGAGLLIVAEADESDGTLALYHPDIAVITNIDFDHMEHFKGVADFEDCFRTFIRQTRKCLIFCAEDPRAVQLCGNLSHCVSYGISTPADLQAQILQETPNSTSFQLTWRQHDLGLFCVPAPGRHNVLNALAGLAIGLELGITPEQLQTSLAKVVLPRRRFERVIDRDDVVVVSDYAHHPAEIKALVNAAKRLERARTFGVFQPHRYTRTLALGADYPPSFAGLDEIVLCPVYAASEAPLAGGSIWDLYAHCRKHPTLRTVVATSLRSAWEYCRNQLQLGDLFLIIGAGDVERIATWAKDDLKTQRVENLHSLIGQAIRQIDLTATRIKGNEPLAGRTSLGVGGRADLWAEIGSESDLEKISRWCQQESIPLQILGGGSNVLVSDLGVRGVVAKLAGAPFCRLENRDDQIVAGAGTPLTRLTHWAAEQGKTGLEFLEGIPGVVGGAVSGNAGAWGGSIADVLSWVRILDRDHRICTLTRQQLEFGYRACPTLRDQIIIEAGFRLPAGNPESIRQKHAELKTRRAWMKGLRSAGSIFKNPPDQFAGKLIEEAGLKGFSVGGASISSHHGNVIVTQPGATASDVLAVLEITRDRVYRHAGIQLDTEIKFME
jgi:UDP-N-acetylmuramate--L-alanine ligase/UDP-N-acetylenolpyruvoylglucosamine reductase